MPLGRTKFAVRVNGELRILFSVLEKPNGEIIIPLRTADRMDSPVGPRLLEQRYSIHPSDRSPDYTTIKQTINAEGGKSITSVMLTDAVKKRNGYSLIFVRRIQNMDEDRYITKIKGNERGFVLANLHPTLHSFFFGIYVGHPETPFPSTDPNIVVNHFPFKRFKLVILTTARLIPSHYTTDYAHAITIPPEIAPDDVTRATFRFQMEGKPPEACIKQFNNTVKLLSRILYERALPEVTEPELIEYVKREIAALSDITMTPVALDKDQQPIHMLSDGKPPSHQSPQQPPVFSRQIGREEDQGG